MKYELCDNVMMDYIGENLIVSCDNGDLVLMGNEVMGLILECIQRGMEHNQIVDYVCNNYSVNKEEADMDVRNVCGVCVNNGVVTLKNS